MKIGFDYCGITTPFYCLDGKGNLLMHKRTKECRDEHERWDTGSGKLELDLSLEENVLKEVSISELKWFPINKLPEPLHTGFAYTYNRYKKYFEKYQK